MARQSALLAAALLLPAAHAIRPSGIARRDAIKAAPPAFFLASAPAWARYDDYKDGPRGLKYIVTEPGAGAMPQRGQSVKAEYTLTLDGFAEDGGRVVDSSKGFLKGPFAFYAGTGGVIKGWDLVRSGVLARTPRRWRRGASFVTRTPSLRPKTHSSRRVDGVELATHRRSWR